MSPAVFNTSSLAFLLTFLFTAFINLARGINFIGTAYNPFHGLAGGYVNAANSGFYVGQIPDSFCPHNVTAPDCSAYPGDITVFHAGESSLGLGCFRKARRLPILHQPAQRIYALRERGPRLFLAQNQHHTRLRHQASKTAACPRPPSPLNHSSLPAPPPDETSRDPCPTPKTAKKILPNWNNRGWLACPVEGKSEGHYQVFVNDPDDRVKGGKECTKLEFRVYEGFDICAWEYI
ncbi:hypothetical protein MKZ38_008828 [Zalerion maritima]|uniref:Uncharacterized protein n=1 Tax=Zalerion maritima TaxID=339359 RepID=A0AAD5RVG0_9PEZI|nr:hypothetical protein MKZ38_008828 [Zalerion maritima]